MYELRDYQIEAVQKSAEYLKSNSKDNGIIVLPTGSGKSLVIASLIKKLQEPTLVFQPSKEILEQNYQKLLAYGYRASIYSASLNSKEISPITFATIGSVNGKADLFRQFKYILVDECHFVNPKQGMYKKFLEMLDGSRVLGLTATPYRLSSDQFGGSILKFLTRTRPRVFKDLVYYVQNRLLFERGYLAKLEYYSIDGFSRTALKENSTGADYTDKSLKSYYKQIKFEDKILNVIKRLLNAGRKNILVFTRFVEESQYLVRQLPDVAEMVTAESSKSERERVILGFRQGKIKVVFNVGILTTGFDYPELSTIVLARPTMSLALYYQMIGRGIRIHPLKPSTWIVDLCKNKELFGKVEDMTITDGGNGKWHIYGEGVRKQLTNVYFQGYERFSNANK